MRRRAIHRNPDGCLPASNAGRNQWRPLPPPRGLRASRRGAANKAGRGLAISSPDRGCGDRPRCFALLVRLPLGEM
jgi:hypothetical protein